MNSLEPNEIFNGATTLCISMNAPHNFFHQFAQKTRLAHAPIPLNAACKAQTYQLT